MGRLERLVDVRDVGAEGHEVARAELDRVACRARPQPAGDDEQVLRNAGVVGVGVADRARVEVERVEVERPAAVGRAEESSGPARRFRGEERLDLRGPDDPQRGPVLLDDARERHPQRGGDRPQRLHARVGLT